MGRKVFVSYKYSDCQVEDLNLFEEIITPGGQELQKITTTARHYVDRIAGLLKEADHIYKGEYDDENMGGLADPTIASKIGDRIFDSSVTIVVISKGMKEENLPEKDQWIPWEISYSLKVQKRRNMVSKTNGVIALVLPDETGSYEYYITRNTKCNCRKLKTSFLFQILRDNMFNAKKPQIRLCNDSWIYAGSRSYIQSVKWKDFVCGATKYIDKAIELRDRGGEFNIVTRIQ